MIDASFLEAREAGTWISLNVALLCMGHEARGLVMDRIGRGDAAEDQVGVVIRSIGGLPSRLFAIVRFGSDALQLPLDIWPRPSGEPRLALVEGEAG